MKGLLRIYLDSVQLCPLCPPINIIISPDTNNIAILSCIPFGEAVNCNSQRVSLKVCLMQDSKTKHVSTGPLLDEDSFPRRNLSPSSRQFHQVRLNMPRSVRLLSYFAAYLVVPILTPRDTGYLTERWGSIFHTFQSFILFISALFST